MYRWYVINTYSGHEKKVKQNLEHRVQSLNQQRAVRQVVVPTETVQEVNKDNQKVSVEKRTMPGYVLVNMDLNDESCRWSRARRADGIRRRVRSAHPADPVRSGPPAAPRGGRPHAEPCAVRDRRVGQGHLRPAL
jgi:transcriptional antiterminator NusG